MLKRMMLYGWMGLLTLALVAPAAAGTLYKWTGPDGAVSYTDDLKRVPSQFRGEATRVKTGGLSGYERFTPSRANHTTEQQARLEARLERLRLVNAEPVAQPRLVTPHTQTVLRVSDSLSLAVPNEAMTGDEPVVVEERRVRDRGAITTRHVTVVRQGDRIVSVVRPESSHNGANWGHERELLGGR